MYKGPKRNEQDFEKGNVNNSFFVYLLMIYSTTEYISLELYDVFQ